MTELPDNYRLSLRLSMESKCQGLPNEPCSRKIEQSRFLYSLTKNLHLPVRCDLCAFRKKNPIPKAS